MRLLFTALATVCVSLGAVSAQAEYKIDDPNAVIPQVQKFLGDLKFETSFHVGDQMDGESRFCKISNGKEVCYPPITITSRVTQVAADKAVMLTKSGEDDDGTEWVVKRETFEKLNGNFVLMFLVEGLGGDKPGPQDSALIEKGEEGVFVLADGSKVPGYTVWITQNIWQAASHTYSQKKVALTDRKSVV